MTNSQLNRQIVRGLLVLVLLVGGLGLYQLGLFDWLGDAYVSHVLRHFGFGK